MVATETQNPCRFIYKVLGVSVCFRTSENARHHRTAKPRLTRTRRKNLFLWLTNRSRYIKNHIYFVAILCMGSEQIGSSGFESSSVASAAELKARFFFVFLGFTFCSGSCNLESDELNSRSKCPLTGPSLFLSFRTFTYTNSFPGTR